MPDLLDLDLLRTFVAIKETGGFNAAGKKIGRTQAAVSHQVKRLEDTLGRPLFERTTRKVRLTSYGELLLGYAQKIIDVNDEAFLRIKDADVAGVLRLGAPEAMTTSHLPRILSLFSRAHPNVMLEVTCGLTDALLHDYEKGEYDVVIFKRGSRSDGQGRVVFTEKLAWMKAASHRLTEGSSTPVILTPEPCVYRKRTIETLQKSNMQWRTAMTLHSLSGRLNAVKEGLGVSLIPSDFLGNGMTVIPPSKRFPNPGSVELAMLPIKADDHGIPGQFIDCVVKYFQAVRYPA